MKRLALLTSLALSLLLAPQALAARSTFTIRGAGFGHGIGLSQYGAYGYAAHGADWRDIVLHYYEGTALGNVAGRTIRVLLQSGEDNVWVTGAARAGSRRLDPDRRYRLMRGGLDSVELRTPRGKKLATFSAPLTVTGSRGSFVLGGRAMNGLSDGRYRGKLEVRPSTFGGGLVAVNALPVDDYIKGVVVGEVPTSWPLQTLEAQAVVARSYALVTDAGGSVFDQYPDTRSQMYYGMSRETDTTNKAVDLTAGQVVMYDGEVASTYYFSTSGGRTENIENSWPGSSPVPYLKSVKDPYDKASPYHRWRSRYSLRRLDSKLGSWVKGRLRAVRVIDRGVSPRIVRAKVVGTRGSTIVTGPELRSRLGLRDTWARFVKITSGRRRAQDPPAAEAPADEQQTTSEQQATDGGGAEAQASRTGAAGLVVEGTVAPRPRFIKLQTRVGRRWRTLGYGETDRRGRYALLVGAPGVYRVLARGAVGPAVRVR